MGQHDERSDRAEVASVAPARSLRDELSIAFRLLIAGGLAIALVLGGWLGWLLTINQPRVVALQRLTATAAQVDEQLQAEQADLRAYLATGDPQYLRSRTSTHALLLTDAAQLTAGADASDAAVLIGLEVAAQRWDQQWAQAVAAGSITAGAAAGHPADPARLAAALASGQQLFTAYDQASARLDGTLQPRLDAARTQQRIATVVAGVVALLIALLAAGVGLRRQAHLRTSVAGPMREIGLGLGALMRGDYDQVAITPGGPAELHGMATLVARLAVRLADRQAQTEALQRREAERTARTELILGVAREVAGSLNLRYVLESVAGAAAVLCQATRAQLWLVEQPGSPMLLSFDSAYGRAGIREQVELDLGAGVAGRAAKYGRPAQGEGPEVADGVPVVAVPLIVGARVVGALECSGGEPRELSEEVLGSLETLATHAAAAIEASRLHQAAEEMSVTDALTGLANRRQLDRDLPAEVERAVRYGRELTVLFLDLDHFKQLNDRYGHSYGDLVLQQVGHVLATELRTVDKAYRLGGEEFVVVAPEASLAEGTGLAERLRGVVARATSQSGTTAGVTASFGVATLPTHGTSGPTLLAAADAALYAAKEAGRDQVRVAEASQVDLPEPRRPYALPPVVGRPSRQVPAADEQVG